MYLHNLHVCVFSKCSTDVTVPEEAPAEVADEIAEYYISCYPYESAEVGDLVFDAGEYITVIKKDGDWWTGTIGTRTGIFPSNYVQPVTDVNTNETDVKATNNLQQNIADDARNQEEADTEVSEINTQQKAENVQEIYSRPMSSSSTVSNSINLFKFSFFKSEFRLSQLIFNNITLSTTTNYKSYRFIRS